MDDVVGHIAWIEGGAGQRGAEHGGDGVERMGCAGDGAVVDE